MSTLVDKIAEQRIQAAFNEGKMDDLPGKGEPLQLDDDSMVPEQLRMGYRVLKNAGYIPPELAERNQAISLCDLVARCTEGSQQRCDAEHKLRQLELRMRLQGVDTRFLHRYLRTLQTGER
ncbi:DnaJ family domain-containing protein [Vibrio sp. CDRSL-10 TSBA]